MTQPLATHAVQRLVDILDQLAKQSGGKEIRVAWARTFNLPEGELGPILEHVGRVHLLAVEARRLLAHVVSGPTQATHVEPVDRLFVALSQSNYESSADPLLREVKVVLSSGLRQSCDIVSRAVGDGLFDDAALASLQAAAEEMLEVTIASSLPDDARALIVTRIEALRAAILSIRLDGPAAVAMAFDALTGAVTREPVVSSDPSVLAKFERLLKAGNTFLEFAERAGRVFGPLAVAVLMGDPTPLLLTPLLPQRRLPGPEAAPPQSRA